MKKQRLTIENRILIEELVKLKYKLKHIAEIIEVDKSTISRELKKRRITGKGIYKECKLTTRFPYVCNGCSEKFGCKLTKYYYKALPSFNAYKTILSESRQGINLTELELANLDRIVSPLIKKRSINFSYLQNKWFTVY